MNYAELSRMSTAELRAYGAKVAEFRHVEPETRAEARKIKRPLVAPDVFVDSAGTLSAWVPVITASETNSPGRDWRARHRRSKEGWRQVSQTLGPHLRALARFAEIYHKHGQIRMTFTRLGGRKMDKSNLPAAMKGIEDALAFMLGADDGDSRWSPRFEQDTTSETVGVKIVIEA